MRRAILAVVAAGGLVGAALVPGSVRLDADADWRAVSQGLRRSPRPGVLVAPADALVHFHDVRGGIASVELVVSARAARGSTRVEVRRGEPMFLEMDLRDEPRTVVVPVEAPTSDIDVGLWPRRSEDERRTGTDRVLVHQVVLRRATSGGGLIRVIPVLCGVVVLLLLRREPARWAGAFGVAAVLIVAAALAAALDPVSLLPLRPPTRTWIQAAAVATLAAAGVARAQSRGVAPLAIAGTVLLLYAPTIRYGLVQEDYLSTRPWSMAEVASAPWASTSHAMDFWLWGFRPKAFHATNLALITAAGLAACALFRRLPITRGAALAGTLVWVAHPMSASAVAWISQRMDTILALLYLGAMSALLARPFGRRQAAVAGAFGVLALGAEELALTLPATMAALLLCLPPDDQRRGRWTAVAGLVLLVMLPLLALRGIDLYRGGLGVAISFGWLAAVLAHRLGERHALLPAGLVALTMLALTPITTEAAAAWGPNGFHRSMTQASIREMPAWLARIQPHGLHHFWGQVSHDEHMAGDE